MKRRSLYLLGIVLLLAFAGFAFKSFTGQMTPYVSFKEARTMNRTLQVAGGLVKGSSSYHDGALYFAIKEPSSGQVMQVRYRGLKPANFEDALSVVAIGRYQGSQLDAEKLLVKCPSKYQGVEQPDGTKLKQYG
jgi:cytochrome c-type biogenesis protein CcmE